ncbi:hypothetical protein IHE44_0006372, partial [Lamprotornis superbus]
MHINVLQGLDLSATHSSSRANGFLFSLLNFNDSNSSTSECVQTGVEENIPPQKRGAFLIDSAYPAAPEAEVCLWMELKAGGLSPVDAGAGLRSCKYPQGNLLCPSPKSAHMGRWLIWGANSFCLVLQIRVRLELLPMKFVLQNYRMHRALLFAFHIHVAIKKCACEIKSRDKAQLQTQSSQGQGWPALNVKSLRDWLEVEFPLVIGANCKTLKRYKNPCKTIATESSTCLGRPQRNTSAAALNSPGQFNPFLAFPQGRALPPPHEIQEKKIQEKKPTRATAISPCLAIREHLKQTHSPSPNCFHLNPPPTSEHAEAEDALNWKATSLNNIEKVACKKNKGWRLLSSTRGTRADLKRSSLWGRNEKKHSSHLPSPRQHCLHPQGAEILPELGISRTFPFHSDPNKDKRRKQENPQGYFGVSGGLSSLAGAGDTEESRAEEGRGVCLTPKAAEPPAPPSPSSAIKSQPSPSWGCMAAAERPSWNPHLG